MSIQSIIKAQREASDLGITYGQLMSKTPRQQVTVNIPKPKRLCKRCKTDISHRHHSAKYCESCSNKNTYKSDERCY